MAEGYMKIQVVEIYQLYKKTSLPELSCYHALKYIGDTIGWFIQWPLSLVKLSSTEATSQNPALTQPAQDNTCYRPELEVPIEQDQSHECYQIDATMIESFGDEFLFGAHNVSTQHDIDGSEEKRNWMRWYSKIDISYNEVLVEQPQAPTLSKLEQDIKTALWNIKNLRPQSMISLATRLIKHYDGDMSIEINWPHVMYPETEFGPRAEYVEHEGMLQLLANGLLDASFIHWCQIRHWVLYIVSPSERKGWILDSTYLRGKKNKSHYSLTTAIETSFGGRFTWKMVKCKHQEGSWECGFLVVRNMFEFFISRQFGFPNNVSFLFFYVL
ncbi:putative papain-like cysteine peptidase superfamily [Helianthus anomalus]